MTAFSREVYRTRTTRLRQQMADRGIDALLVLEEGSINYLTGYEGYSDYVPQVALVCQDEEDPWLIMRELDTHCAMDDSYLPESHVLSYAEKYIGSSELTGWQPIGDLVRERSKSSRIGVELSGKMLGVKGHAALSKSLGVTEFIDADRLVATLKAVKSPAELSYMEEAGKIVDRAMKVAHTQIADGVRECDVAAAVQHSLSSGTPAFPGGPSHIGLPLMATGSPQPMP